MTADPDAGLLPLPPVTAVQVIQATAYLGWLPSGRLIVCDPSDED